MTSIVLDTPLNDHNGNPYPDNEDLAETPEPLTISKVIRKALVAVVPSDANESIDKKMERYKLFKKLSPLAGNDVKLTPEELVSIKNRVHQTYGTLILGQIVDHIER